MKKGLRNIALAFFGVLVSGCGDMSKTSKEITTIIENNCDCIVYTDISSYGITFSKKAPSSMGERYEFVLEDWNEEDKETLAAKINNALIANDSINKNSLIALNFKKKDSILKQVFIKDLVVLE